LKLAEEYNNKDIETALTIFVDTGLDYSDYGTFHPPLLPPSLLPTPINIKSHETSGVNALYMTKAAFNLFLNSIFGSLEPLSLKTIAISGNKEFTLGNGSGVRQKVGDKSGFQDLNKGAEGQMQKMREYSFTWWNEDDKMVKNCD
jgi:hypothetical protein